ncbi:MAG: peroxiredoxin [Armatimonadetes bacterium]|nr:peroxiredoxin [Armatimonadota bacterium]
MKPAQVGQAAPTFALEGVSPDGTFETYSLNDYLGRWVVLFFYPLDFTFICPTEVMEFNRRCPEFEERNAAVFGISVDSVHCHKAWIDKQVGKLDYPLLSDITKETSRAFGILMKEQGIALRGTFIIDPSGIVRYQAVLDISVGRSVSETLRVLSALSTEELCPVDWRPGQATLGKVH